MAESIHPHPTLSETLGFAAEVYLGTATDLYRPKTPQEGSTPLTLGLGRPTRAAEPAIGLSAHQQSAISHIAIRRSPRRIMLIAES